MKKMLLICFNVLFIVWPSLSLSEVFVNETFDDGVFGPEAKYCCDVQFSPLPIGSGDCSGCTNAIQHVTDSKRTGSHSLKCVYNQYGAAGVKILPSQYGKSDFGTDVYVRMYVKWDQNFRFYHRVKLWRLHSAGNDPYLNVNGCEQSGSGTFGDSISGTPYADIGFYSADNQFKYVSIEMGNKGYESKDWVITAGDDWWLIEVHLYQEGGNPKFDLWVQRPEDSAPVLVFNNVTQPNMATGPFGELDMNWINDVGSGSGGTFWIDEVVLANQYIGPIEGEVPSLGSPQEFRKE